MTEPKSAADDKAPSKVHADREKAQEKESADRQKDAEEKADARSQSDRKAAERYDRERPEFDSYAEIARVRAGVMAAPAPGSDPDSKQRIAKELQSRNIELPDGYAVDPVTDEDRTVHTESGADNYDKYLKQHEDARERDGHDTAHEEAFESDSSSEGKTTKASAASKRAAASTSTTATPQGRSTAPQAQGAEGK